MAINTKGLTAKQIRDMAAKNAAAEAQAKAEREALLQAQIDAMKAENAALKARTHRTDAVVAKITTKGQISVGGLSGWPVTMYLADWRKLAAYIKSGQLDSFVNDHLDECSTRPAKVA